MDNQLFNERLKRLSLKGYDKLTALALDLSWTWSHCTDLIWQQLDEQQWDRTKNPWSILHTVSTEKLEKFLADKDFLAKIEQMYQIRQQQANSSCWFQEKYSSSSLSGIAYFSMEFMLSEALPIYSGGLGNVAGDFLKASSDLGVPVTAVGLLYQQGYFRQVIDKDGSQRAFYPYNEPGQLPITPLRQKNGEWLRIEIPLPGNPLWLRVWQARIGRIRLFLLDSNDMANLPPQRGITSELYGGGSELRLQQELILGVGGWRLLQCQDIHPEICHMNEGHAAFVVLERAFNFMNITGQNFFNALEATRAGNLFTTHTPVSAGFDRFSPSLMHQYFTRYVTNRLKITMDEFLGLGRLNPQDPNEEFNMAYLAIRGSSQINGVSELHSRVSKHLFSPLFPRWPIEEIPIGYVTNGIHIPSWDSKESDELWEKLCGKDRWLGSCQMLSNIRTATDQDIWNMRNMQREKLVQNVRKRVERYLYSINASQEKIDQAKNILDPNILTLGFARRFASYKRPNMLLSDKQRFLTILRNKERPVQLLVAGKAHPEDALGQNLIREWTHFIAENNLQNVVFLSDYDMLLAQELVEGIDVWINNPRRPWEASGTSGMKILANGGLNLSELDGWWAEAYQPNVGWAIGDGLEHGDDPLWDNKEACALYDLIENEISREFYSRNNANIPEKWIERVRESMASLTPQYSANRMVREYTEKYYLEMAKIYRKRADNQGHEAIELQKWHEKINIFWPKVVFNSWDSEEKEGKYTFFASIYLSELKPEDVKVELFAQGQPAECHQMNCIKKIEQQENTYLYSLTIDIHRQVSDYTIRAIPQHDAVFLPLEVNQIAWQH